MRVVPQTLSALEQRYGKLTPLGGGYSSQVYAAGDKVLKVYRSHHGTHRLEADHLRRAGLGAWVLETLELQPAALPDLALEETAEVLVMRRFEGHPVKPDEIPAILPTFGRFLRQLHANTGEEVDLNALHQKLLRFDEALSQTTARANLEVLFQCVRHALESGALNATSSLCHLDLWWSNVLFAPPDRVLVVDWHKSAYDDPARDYALFFTGTLELLPIAQARDQILQLTDAEGVTDRLPPYIALSTLHDLYWLQQKQPDGFAAGLDLKLPRTLEMLP